MHLGKNPKSKLKRPVAYVMFLCGFYWTLRECSFGSSLNAMLSGLKNLIICPLRY